MEEVFEFNTLMDFVREIMADSSLDFLTYEYSIKPIQFPINSNLNRTRRTWCINTKYQNKIVKIEGLFFLFYVDLSSVSGNIDWIMKYNRQYAQAFIVLEPI